MEKNTRNPKSRNVFRIITHLSTLIGKFSDGKPKVISTSVIDSNIAVICPICITTITSICNRGAVSKRELEIDKQTDIKTDTDTDRDR